MSRLSLTMTIVVIVSFIMFSGCANTAVSVWDGVIRNDEGTSLTNYFKNSLVTEDVSEAEVERGNCFISSHIRQLDSGETYYYTGDTDGRTITLELRKVTVIDLGNSNTETRIDLWENVTTITQGDKTPTYNLNRDIIYLKDIQNYTFDIYNGSTIDFTGAQQLEPLSEVLTSEKTQASFLNQEVQYILRRNTTYALNVSNVGVGDTEIKFLWRWCENEKKD